MKRFIKQFLGILLGLFFITFVFATVVQWNNSKLELSQNRMLFTSGGTTTGTKVADINSGGKIIMYGPLVDGNNNNFITGGAVSGTYMLLANSGDYFNANSGAFYLATNPSGYIDSGSIPTQVRTQSGDLIYPTDSGTVARLQVGIGSSASGDYSTAIGNNAQASGDYSFVAGGDSNQANGDWSIAGGYGCIASGGYDIALGADSQALGGYSSIAMGNASYAVGPSSVAIGSSNLALGNTSLAIGGDANLASGNFSIAMGHTSRAIQPRSVSIGRYLVGNSTGGFNIGQFNLGLTNSIFELGNGAGVGSEANAITAYNTGVVQFNAYTTDGFLKFTGANGTIEVDTETYYPTSNPSSYITTADVPGAEVDPTFAPFSGMFYRTPVNINYVGIQYAGPAVAGTNNLINVDSDGFIAGGTTNQIGTYELDSTCDIYGLTGTAGSEVICPIEGDGGGAIIPGVGINILKFESASTPVEVNLGVGTATRGTDNYTISNLAQTKRVIGTDANDILTGGQSTSWVDGGLGADMMFSYDASSQTTFRVDDENDCVFHNTLLVNVYTTISGRVNTGVGCPGIDDPNLFRIYNVHNVIGGFIGGGRNLLNYSSYGSMFGQYNLGLANSLFEIGNGTSTNARSNALTINNSGVAQFNYGIVDANNNPYLTGISSSGTSKWNLSGTLLTPYYTGTTEFQVGYGASAGGQHSIAMGAGCFAGGSYATCIGGGSSAGGDNSISMGNSAQANYSFAVAIGHLAISDGFASTTIGEGTYAINTGAISIGRYNLGITGAIFELGFGTDASNRANALTVLTGGNVGIGDSTPTQALTVSGNVKSNSQIFKFNTLVLEPVADTGDIQFGNSGGKLEFYVRSGGMWELQFSTP